MQYGVFRQVLLISLNFYFVSSLSYGSPKKDPDSPDYTSKLSHPLTFKVKTRELPKDPFGNRYSRYQRMNFSFSCPGHSLMTGIESNYKYFRSAGLDDDSNVDRNFKFTCQFLVDEIAKPIVKKCPDRQKVPFPSKVKPNKLAEPKSLNGVPKVKTGTKGDFIHAFASQRFFPSVYWTKPVTKHGKDDKKTAEATQNLHLHSVDQPEWCSVHDSEGKAYEAYDCENSQLTQPKQKFDFKCPVGKYMRAIKSNWSWDFLDRSYLFQCCSIRLSNHTSGE